MFLRQLQAKDEALEKLQCNPHEVKCNSSTPCIFLNNDFTTFEEHTRDIGSKLLKRMDYEGKGLNINGHPIKVAELSPHIEIGYVRKEIGECTKIACEPPMIDDEKTSSILSNSTVEEKHVDFPSVSSSHSILSIGNAEIPITGTNMRLLTRTRYKEEEALGVKIKGITLPLEVEIKP